MTAMQTASGLPEDTVSAACHRPLEVNRATSRHDQAPAGITTRVREDTSRLPRAAGRTTSQQTKEGAAMSRSRPIAGETSENAWDHSDLRPTPTSAAASTGSSSPRK